MVAVLKKEVVKTNDAQLEKGGEYRQLLVGAIHSCAVKFPAVAGNVIQLLMDFLSDTNTAAALDVVFFMREIMQTHAPLRPTILARLLDGFNDIRSSRVASCALWIIAEFCTSLADIQKALEVRGLSRLGLCLLFS